MVKNHMDTKADRFAPKTVKSIALNCLLQFLLVILLLLIFGAPFFENVFRNNSNLGWGLILMAFAFGMIIVFKRIMVWQRALVTIIILGGIIQFSCSLKRYYLAPNHAFFWDTFMSPLSILSIMVGVTIITECLLSKIRNKFTWCALLFLIYMISGVGLTSKVKCECPSCPEGWSGVLTPPHPMVTCRFFVYERERASYQYEWKTEN